VGSAIETRLERVGTKATCVLTHRGRNTGKPYQVMIWFTADGDHVHLQTMNVKRQWVRNLIANPKVSLRIGDETFEGTARALDDGPEMQRVVQLMRKKYPIAIPYLWWKKRPDGAFRVELRD
jgi:deazaflavin-dependent oxidoreductase (nitroreductase family)